MKTKLFDMHKEVDKLNEYFAEKGWTIKQTKKFLNFYLENVDDTQKIVKTFYVDLNRLKNKFLGPMVDNLEYRDDAHKCIYKYNIDDNKEAVQIIRYTFIHDMMTVKPFTDVISKLNLQNGTYSFTEKVAPFEQDKIVEYLPKDFKKATL